MGKSAIKETVGVATLNKYFNDNKIKLAVPVSKDELVTINFMIVDLLWVYAMNKKHKELNNLFGFNSDRIAKDLATGIKNHTGAHSASEKIIKRFCEEVQIPASDFNGDNLLITYIKTKDPIIKIKDSVVEKSIIKIKDSTIEESIKNTNLIPIYRNLVAYRRLSVMANHSRGFLANDAIQKNEVNSNILKGLLREDDWKEVINILPRLKSSSIKDRIPTLPETVNEDYALLLIDTMQNETSPVDEYFDVVKKLKNKYENRLKDTLITYFNKTYITSDEQTASFQKLMFSMKFVYANPAVHRLVTSITKKMELLDEKNFSDIVKLSDTTKDAYINELTRHLEIFKASKYY